MRRDTTLETLDSAEARVRYLLRRIALNIDPDAGQLNALCVKYGWHETTISRWQARGGVPRDKAVELHKDFSKLIGFNLEDLIGNTDSE